MLTHSFQKQKQKKVTRSQLDFRRLLQVEQTFGMKREAEDL